jgi:hypothetical protein
MLERLVASIIKWLLEFGEIGSLSRIVITIQVLSRTSMWKVIPWNSPRVSVLRLVLIWWDRRIWISYLTGRCRLGAPFQIITAIVWQWWWQKVRTTRTWFRDYRFSNQLKILGKLCPFDIIILHAAAVVRNRRKPLLFVKGWLFHYVRAAHHLS